MWGICGWWGFGGVVGGHKKYMRIVVLFLLPVKETNPSENAVSSPRCIIACRLNFSLIHHVFLELINDAAPWTKHHPLSTHKKSMISVLEEAGGGGTRESQPDNEYRLRVMSSGNLLVVNSIYQMQK